MTIALLPADETDRLAALSSSGLLQKRPSSRIRVLTSLAASLLHRPSAALSLVAADRQVFRPSIGMPSTSTSRDVSFCAHAILSPDKPMIVRDSHLDPRFADNPLVTGVTPIRFYAGVPIRVRSGHAIGALCVIDRVPGDLDDGQIIVLQDLAREIEDTIAVDRPGMGDRLTLLQELREATLTHGFTQQWQPIAEADTLRVVGYEALVRWRRRCGTPVAPDEFIPLAEVSGLIGRIDQFMLREACEALACRPGDHRVSVNVSANWFGRTRSTLPGVVAQILKRSGLSEDRLVVELTERMLIAEPERAAREMRELRAMGVRLALDDFGTGYSSLSYLEAFPFHTVKLDKSFVRGLGRNVRAEAIARAIIRLGHDLGMAICAEGVEQTHQLDFLRIERCDLVQGYLIGRPHPIPVERSLVS